MNDNNNRVPTHGSIILKTHNTRQSLELPQYTDRCVAERTQLLMPTHGGGIPTTDTDYRSMGRRCFDGLFTDMITTLMVLITAMGMRKHRFPDFSLAYRLLYEPRNEQLAAANVRKKRPRSGWSAASVGLPNLLRHRRPFSHGHTLARVSSVQLESLHKIFTRNSPRFYAHESTPSY